MKKIVIGLLIIFSMFVSSNVFVAQTAYAAVDSKCSKSFLGLPPWYKYLDVGEKNEDPCAIIGPKKDGELSGLDFEKAIPRIILAIIDILLRIAGMVAVGYVIFGGFRYITAQGEPDKLAQAQGTIINALIGLAIAVLSVTVVSFVGGTLF